MAKTNTYGLILSSDFDYDELYAYSFEDESLVEWLNEPVDFDGSSVARIAIPGSTRKAGVTIGSADNDKLLALVSCSESHDPHPSLVEITASDPGEAYELLLEICHPDNIFEGLVY